MTNHDVYIIFLVFAFWKLMRKTTVVEIDQSRGKKGGLELPCWVHRIIDETRHLCKSDGEFETRSKIECARGNRGCAHPCFWPVLYDSVSSSNFQFCMFELSAAGGCPARTNRQLDRAFLGCIDCNFENSLGVFRLQLPRRSACWKKKKTSA